MLLRSDKTSVEKGEQLALWENKAYEFSQREYNSSVIDLQVFRHFEVRLSGGRHRDSRQRNDSRRPADDALLRCRCAHFYLSRCLPGIGGKGRSRK